MKLVRLNDPVVIDRDEIANHVAEGTRVIVQYSKPGYSELQLTPLNELARAHGRNLEIRFYGHYFEAFDASVLQFVPDAQCVSVDCLMKATGLEALSHLRNLRELSLGVFELEDADVLANCNVSSLKCLSLGETRKCSIDLAHLSRCAGLEEFGTAGHVKNIATICGLALHHLSLRSIKGKDSIAFVTDIPQLKSLQVILGGRSSIAEVSATQLRTLEIVRVRGLSDIGDIGRFEHLEHLAIQDQLKLTAFSVGPNPALKDVKVINCKSLTSISGISELKALTSLRIYRTAIEYDQLVQQELPEKLKVLAFFTGKSGRDGDIRRDLDRRGFGPSAKH